MKKKWFAAALAGTLLAVLLLNGCASAQTAKRLRFGVAGEGGVYHAFGELYAALENETDNGTVELKTTAGSAANLRLLTGEYLQLAIAQGAFLPMRRRLAALARWRRCTPRPARSWCGQTRTSSPWKTYRARP